jgi:ABC-2 type transport system permease protein
LLAFTLLLIHTFQLGVMPVIIAIPAVVLQLIFTVVLSRVSTSLLRKLTRSQFSSALSSMVTGAIMAFFITGWLLLDTEQPILTLGFLPQLSTILYALPSGWGIAAVYAAHNGQWALASVCLAGLGLLILVLRSIWTILLVSRLTVKSKRGRTFGRREIRLGRFAGQTGAVARKEFVAWSRDFTRSGFVYFAFFYSFFLCVYPFVVGNAALLPWCGGIFVITAIGSTSNLYGSDGSALWMTLVTPDAERPDVRGRQLAWILVVAPIALVTTLAMISISGSYWAMPWALTIVLAALGAGAGLVVLNSVFRLDPMTDANKRSEDMFDNPIGWWQFMSLMIAALLLVAPSVGVLVLGASLQMDGVVWAGIPTAILTGSFYWWWFGRLAYKSLEARGPELLNQILRGRAALHPVSESGSKKLDFDKVTSSMSGKRKTVFFTSTIVGLLALFPQGIVPLGIKLSGGGDPVWFLALYFPEAWQWPCISLMASGGLLIFGHAVFMYLSQKRTPVPR